MYEIYEMLDEFLIALQAESKAATTVKTRKKHLQGFFKWLYANCSNSQKIEATDVTVRLIRAYMLAMKESGRRETYINSILKSIRSFYNFMVEESYMIESPAAKVKFMKEERTLIRTFTDIEIQALLDVYKRSTAFLPTRNKLIIMLFADTGLRVSELVQLRDTDFQGTSIIVRGKGSKQRAVYLSPAVAKQLARYQRIKQQYFRRTGRAYTDLLFTNFYAERITPEGINRMLKRTAERTGRIFNIRVSAHTLRHYFAQKYIESGDIYTLSTLLGHSSLETTRTYLRSMTSETIISRGISASPIMNLNKR